jgi:hypothetical protein
MSDSYDCSRDFEMLDNKSGPRYYQKTLNLRAPRTSSDGFIGYMLATFMGSKNRSPIEGWHTTWAKGGLLLFSRA